MNSGQLLRDARVTSSGLLASVVAVVQVKMSLQLYQVDQKSFLLDFKSLNTQDHPDAARVKRMTRASMSVTSDSGERASLAYVCIYRSFLVAICQFTDYLQ